MSHIRKEAVFPTWHREHRFLLSVVFYVVSEISFFKKTLKSKEKHPFSLENGCFLELLGRFELPTSSLPRMRSTD